MSDRRAELAEQIVRRSGELLGEDHSVAERRIAEAYHASSHDRTAELAGKVIVRADELLAEAERGDKV